MNHRNSLIALTVAGLVLALPAAAGAETKVPALPSNGGQQYGAPNPANVPIAEGSSRARRLSNGKAAAPENAPDAVQKAVWAANRIVGKPYRYGGGHGRFEDSGYDCSGTISYALHGAGLLRSPLDSGSFMRWGKSGKGDWITVYTNPGHAYIVIAGLRLDTSAADDPRGGKGPRWRPLRKSNAGFVARRPAGF